MSRAVIYDALTTDSRMVALGFHVNTSANPEVDNANVLVNYDGEQRPSDTMFITIGWEEDDEVLRGDDNNTRKFWNFTLYFHMYDKFSTDYMRLIALINTVDEIFEELIHVPGDDGYTLTLIETGSRSRDLKDESYETICKSANYKLLCRETALV